MHLPVLHKQNVLHKHFEDSGRFKMHTANSNKISSQANLNSDKNALSHIKEVLRRAGGGLSELKLKVLFSLSHCLRGSQHSVSWTQDGCQSSSSLMLTPQQSAGRWEISSCVFCSQSKHSEGRNDRKYAPSPFLMGGWFNHSQGKLDYQD